ncbi:MAG: nitrogenase component 1 [Lachnospiraceae bacterium]|nr:nitrogenase component 1 [Lachnospiraceae bacterium]
MKQYPDGMESKYEDQRRCTIEEITLNHSFRQYVVLPEIIFQTDDVILIGAGSFSCVRALYRTAVKQRALGRFYYEVITPEEYALGKAEEIIQHLIERALKRSDAGGIIYYASCMDVISKIDFQRIRKNLSNPNQVPVEVLFRGPMVRRYLDSNKKLTELLLRIPVSKRMLRGEGYDLPPMMPDFEAICGVLQSWEVYRFLISSGGCDGCISGTGKNDDRYQVTKSRVNDLQIAMGCEELIQNGILWDYQKKGCRVPAYIAGAGLPKLIGFDYKRVERTLQKEGLDCTMVKSDGFHFAQQGIADLYMVLLQKYARQQPPSGKIIGILGANCFSSLEEEEVQEAVRCLKKMGNTVIWPETMEPEAMAELNGASRIWAVSAEGIAAAKYLYQKNGTPYMIGIPAGKRLVLWWKKFFQGDQELPVLEMDSRGKSAKRVLLIGDPAVTWGIGKYLSETGADQVSYAMYAQLPSVRRWYTSVLQDTQSHWIGGGTPCENIRFFRNRAELKELLEGADVIFGELLLKMAFTEQELYQKKWTDLPTPILNCGIRSDKYEYHLFGIKGARWIKAGAERKGL